MNPKSIILHVIKKVSYYMGQVGTHEFRSCDTVTILFDLRLQSIPEII